MLKDARPEFKGKKVRKWLKWLSELAWQGYMFNHHQVRLKPELTGMNQNELEWTGVNRNEDANNDIIMMSTPLFVVSQTQALKMELPSHTLICIELLSFVERWAFYLWIGQNSEKEMLTLEALSY